MSFARASCVLLLLIAAPVAAQRTLEPGAAADVGMSPAVLGAAAELYREAVAAGEVRGAVLLVARRGRIVLHEAIGWRDAETQRPMTTDTLFRMASNTKPLVATAALMLAEDGKLELDDCVRRHLPSFDNWRAGWIRVSQLLTHTSGLEIPGVFARPLTRPTRAHPDAPSLRSEVTRIGRIGASSRPGTRYRYSNAGYNALGALVEVAAEQPLAEFLAERIYRPLGMTDSCNHESAADPRRMGNVYRKSSGQWRVRWRPKDGPDYPFVRASGGMISTAIDYAHFCQMYLNGGIWGDTRLLSAETVHLATRPHTADLYDEETRERRRFFYGYGWRVWPDGTYSHTGSDGTFAWVDPAREIVGLALTQSRGGANPYLQAMRVVAAACRD